LLEGRAGADVAGRLVWVVFWRGSWGRGHGCTGRWVSLGVGSDANPGVAGYLLAWGGVGCVDGC